MTGNWDTASLYWFLFFQCCSLTFYLSIFFCHSYLQRQKGRSREYRLVNLTSVPRKVMEQLILETNSRHMKNKKMIRRNQHGLTKRKLCLTNPIAFYDVTAGLVDKGRAVRIVYLYFSKAFDTVSCKNLIEKATKY